MNILTKKLLMYSEGYVPPADKIKVECIDCVFGGHSSGIQPNSVHLIDRNASVPQWANNMFNYMEGGTLKISNVNKVTQEDNNLRFQYGFNIWTGGTIEFTDLTEVTNDKDIFFFAFTGQEGVEPTEPTYIKFPALKTVSFETFSTAFAYTLFREIRFDKLDTFLDADWNESRAFYNCFRYIDVDTLDIYFPAITNNSFGTAKDQFNQMINGGSAEYKVHFPSNLKSIISTLDGYSDNFSLDANTTILFDLPATY